MSPVAKITGMIVMAAVLLTGCQGASKRLETPAEAWRLIRPITLRIHPMTRTASFDENGSHDGLDVRVETADRFGHVTKAVGRFRFEMYHYRRGPNPRGKRIGLWEMNVASEEALKKHWLNVFKMFRFNLGWDRPVKPGRRFVLEATLTTPDGRRFTDQKVLIAGTE